ncbi:MAG: lysyl oxidase family protein [Actinomycetota bacterium]|nr:lysyl oxidase family protein [Actinomycetota bacterium]
MDAGRAIPNRRTSARGVVGMALTVLLIASAVATGQTSLAQTKARNLLPNLVPLPTRHVQVGEYLDGCDNYEVVEQGARRCLRYDTIVANFGQGALEMRYLVNSIATDQQLRQRIFRSDGSHRDVVADTYEVHPTHAHFHYANFAQAHLWRSDARGKRLGTKPVRSGKKAGFCLLDIEDQRKGTKYDQPATYNDLSTCLPVTREETSVSQVNGLSVGWADIYGMWLTDQYIEVTGVRDGYYVLEIEVDPLDTVVERNDSDNSVFSHVKLSGDSVRLVKTGEDVPDPKKRTRRIVESSYIGSSGVAAAGADTGVFCGYDIGCAMVNTRHGDNWVRVAVDDDEAAGKISAKISMADEDGWVTQSSFCGSMREPIPIPVGTERMTVRVFAGACGEEAAIPTGGTITFTISNRP